MKCRTGVIGEETVNLVSIWAKNTSENLKGIIILNYKINLGFVDQSLSENALVMVGRSQLHGQVIGIFADLHDLGNIFPGFQSKVAAWLTMTSLIDIDRTQPLRPNQNVNEICVNYSECSQGNSQVNFYSFRSPTRTGLVLPHKVFFSIGIV